MLPPRERNVDVLIIGAGPAGLAAATELAGHGVGNIEVLEREHVPGGIPRHSNHTGYGLRDLHKIMSGPAYARHYTEAAIKVGAIIRTGVTATGWLAPRSLEVTGPEGLECITARAVILATGARERSRSARLIPGTRPSGIYTTGLLQQLVYVHGQRIEGRAVIVGAEHVSYSAAVTLHHAGARVVGMVTDFPRHQSYTLFRFGAAMRYRFPLLTSTSVTRLLGREQLEGVEIRHPDGRMEIIAADAVVFTGDWIPDHELARRGGIDLNNATKGPSIDTDLATNIEGVFAAGNLLHPVETADVVALDGRHVARSVMKFLDGSVAPVATLNIGVEPPLQWITPDRIGVGTAPPRDRFILRSDASHFRPTLEVTQGERLLYRYTVNHWVGPNRSVCLPSSWLSRVDPKNGPLLVREVW